MAKDIITITGHRLYHDPGALYRGLDSMSAKQYYFGGARGVDTDALVHIGKTQPGSIRTVVVPNRVINQPASARAAIGKYSTNVVELKNTGPDRFMIRNRYMVDRSTRVSSFYDFRGRGGTFNTIEYSRRIGKPFNTFPLQEYNVDQFRRMSQGEFGEWLKKMKGYNLNLSSIKGLILNVINEIYFSNVGAFFDGMGYSGVKTIEDFWLR